MSNSSSSSDFAPSPTVSKEKWALHARSKLLKGYVLIIAHGRRSASFFKEGRGFEPCPFKIAKALVEMGLIVQEGTHFLGERYVLSTEAPEPPPVVEVDDDDEEDGEDQPQRDSGGSGMEVLLDDLEQEKEADDEEEEEAEGENDVEDEEEDY